MRQKKSGDNRSFLFMPTLATVIICFTVVEVVVPKTASTAPLAEPVNVSMAIVVKVFKVIPPSHWSLLD